MKENEQLKAENSSRMKKILKIQQINNYIITAQQNRDKLISELTQENKNLKNKLDYYQSLTNSPKEIKDSKLQTSLPWLTPNKITEFSTFPYLNSSKNIKRGLITCKLLSLLLFMLSKK